MWLNGHEWAYGTEVPMNTFYKSSRVKQYVEDAGSSSRDRDQLAHDLGWPAPDAPFG